MFLKFYVTLTEKTKVDVSLQHFEIQDGTTMLTSHKRKATDKEREDKEAKIELLTNMKLFLQEKVVQSEQKQATTMKDIAILKEMLRIEKLSNQKKDSVIKQRETELKETRDNYLEQQAEWLMKKNEMTTKVEEQIKTI